MVETFEITVEGEGVTERIKKAIDIWLPERVKNFIVACRRNEGLPVFRTRVLGKKVKDYVFGMCWGAEEKVPSKVFMILPEEKVDYLKEDDDDWKRLLKRWGFTKELEECEWYDILP